MSANTRLEDLRRRVQQDPSSIAFAQLGEEYRRGGQLQEAVDVCRAGLTIHPGYLSARVTLGRALLELQDLEAAQQELELVLKSAAENLAAIRGLAEIHHRRGSLAEALVQYRRRSRWRATIRISSRPSAIWQRNSSRSRRRLRTSCRSSWPARRWSPRFRPSQHCRSHRWRVPRTRSSRRTPPIAPHLSARSGSSPRWNSGSRRSMPRASSATLKHRHQLVRDALARHQLDGLIV